MAISRLPSWPGLSAGHTFKDADLAGKLAAGYFRVSDNPEDETKSVDDQEREYLGWVDRTGVVSATPDRFKDDDRSASMFAKRRRENFARLLAAIEAERYKVVWFWSTSRQTRGDVNIYELAKTSASHGVLWCVAGQLLNPANEDDLLFLGIHHLMDRQYSWRISKDVRRGKESAAMAGRPAIWPVYGYRRVYDTTFHPPKFVCDEPSVFDGNGRAIQDSPAYIVREIYDRLAGGASLSGIRRALEDRGIPTPRSHIGKGDPDGRCRWTTATIRGIATNPAYIGKRVYQARGLRFSARLDAVLEGVEVKWPPLVSEEQFYTVQNILNDPGRLRTRERPAGRRAHLLTAIVKCGVCGSSLAAHKHKSDGVIYLECKLKGCAATREDWLDAYVDDRIVSWLADPDIYTHLWQARENDSEVAAAARADVERLKHQIEECRLKGEDPDADAVFWERRSRALAAKLSEAGELARPASLSPVLAGVIGPDAADKWWKLRNENTAAARQVIAMVADIRLNRGKRGGHWKLRTSPSFDEKRVEWRWLLGPHT